MSEQSPSHDDNSLINLHEGVFTEEVTTIESQKGSLMSLDSDEELFDNEFDPAIHLGSNRHPARKRPKQTSESSPDAKAPPTNARTSVNSEPTSKDRHGINIWQVLGKTSAKSHGKRTDAQLDGMDMRYFAVPDIDERMDSLLNADDSILDDIAAQTDDREVTDILFGDIDDTPPQKYSAGPASPQQAVSPVSASSNQASSTPQAVNHITPMKSTLTFGGQRSAHSIKSTKANNITFLNTSENSLVTPEKEFQVLMSEEKSCDFVQIFWIDAREMRQTNDVFFFGKIFLGDRWQSCCVRIEAVERCVLVLPKDRLDDGRENTIADVARELSEVCQRHGIKKRSFKSVYRWYSFEKPNVPTERKWWIKMKYSSHDPLLPATGQYKTFTEVFGTHQSMLEMILLKRKIMGPCWLKLTNSQRASRHLSHCQVEFVVPSYKNISVDHTSELSIPPIKVCSVSLATNYSEQTKSNEIYAVSILTVDQLEQEKSAKLPSLQKSLWNTIRKTTNDYVFPFQIADVFTRNRLPVPSLAISEKRLLEDLLSHLKTEDPDVLIGHNFLSFHLDLLLHRFQFWSIPNWSMIGRLKLHEMPKLQSGPGGLGESSYAEKEVLAGRLVCDTYLLAKEYIKASNYSLKSLVQQLELEEMGFGTAFKSEHSAIFQAGESDENCSFNFAVTEAYRTKESLFALMVSASEKAIFSTAIALHIDVIPLTKRMTNITGSVWSRTLCGSRSERIEFLLLHKFHAAKFVVPDKPITSKAPPKEDAMEIDEQDPINEKPLKSAGRRKPQYTGGMVLEPKRGLYESYVLLLDFNSLYPSIIQEFNLCFTTLLRQKSPPTPGDGAIDFDAKVHVTTLSDVQKLICDHCEAEGHHEIPCTHRNVLPKILKELVDGRRHVKKLMQSTTDEEQQQRLNIRQKALKLTANSMYGCLGFQMGRFYAPAIAELVTSQGRNALQNAVSLVAKADSRLDVIYGDTDSVMINAAFAQSLIEVRRVANIIKDTINKCYKTLEIDIDGVFRKLLLLQKKKYASLRIVDYLSEGIRMEREIKGLDLVRREWCALSKQMSSDIIDMILSTEPQPVSAGETIREYIENVVQKVNEGLIPPEDFIITKALNRDPEEYANPADHPHVCVAMRMKDLKLSVQVGDLIPYIIGIAVVGGPKTSTKLSAHSYHPQELLDSNEICIDLEWYKKVQLYPPIMRLLEYVPECNSATIAKIFGLEGVRHAQNLYSEAKKHEKVPQRAEELLDVPEIAFPTAKHLLCQCTRKECGATVDILPHAYLFDRAMEHVNRVIDGNSNEVAECPWIACRECNAIVSFEEVCRQISVLYDELKEETQRKMADCALHQRDTLSGDLFEPLFNQLNYFSSLFNLQRISKFLVHNLERSIADKEPHIMALSQAFGATGRNPSEIAHKIAMLTIQSTKRIYIWHDADTDAVSPNTFTKHTKIKTEHEQKAIDMYDEIQRKVEQMLHTVHGYSISVVDIIGCMRQNA